MSSLVKLQEFASSSPSLAPLEALPIHFFAILVVSAMF